MAKKKKTPAKSKKPSGTAIAAKWMEVAKERGMTAQAPAARKSGALLWKLLEDDMPSVRHAAGFALASIRDPSIVQAFILELNGASSSKAAKAALTLGQAGFVNAAPYFASTFTRDDAKASAAFALALGMLADRSAAPLLIDALENDFVPAEAAVALGQLDDVSAVPALTKALGHKKDSVRAAAAYSLACLGAASEEEHARVQQGLAALERDPSPRVRLCAAVARFERGDDKGLDAVRAALA
jgi:HEAT repeat protein